MKVNVKRAFIAEMDSAQQLYEQGQFTKAFFHLERAHILGQAYVIPHTQSHWWMLKVGLKTHDAREVLGQIPRMLASVIFSRIWVPVGNTGGAKVSPFEPMAIPEDLKAILQK
ncbi:conserved hypothetical protein [Shewanella denitrificans OS217]|jgi:hypothetical protein|uniref:DUF3703 domain-containing protein n=1 Tax=Shewanella denitrificans (strain OS217 / ATCC BAA-1090 / DSM 15013) TaxID=318161 RepID=Q12RM8_SHEDO|nr:DUF3703 domain-containing protein [Shewanella denitrificans]ABE53898.1 conserved hypothetical protein [Shewanella denitrificans OS217]